MNDMFYKFKDKIIKVRGYKINDECCIIKLIFFNKCNICMIVNNDKIVHKWQADNSYIIAVNESCNMIHSYLTEDKAFTFDLEINNLVAPTKHRDFRMIIFDWEEEIDNGNRMDVSQYL